MNQLTFITGNVAKVEQLRRHLDYPLFHKHTELTEIQSLLLKEVVVHKVKEAYSHIKKPVLVEDSSLTFPALGRLPGPFIKYFLQELGNDGLARLLDSDKERRAVCDVSFALYDGMHMHIFTAVMAGTISLSPKGKGGFGWDPIFINDGYTKTRGEMTLVEYEETSARRKAIVKLHAYLKRLP